MNDNARKLYDALSEEYDLGTFEQFSLDIQDENKRRKLYDATIQEYDFGEYDSFSKQLGFGGESIATIQPKAEEVKPVVSPVYSEEQQDSVWGTYKNVGAVKPAVQSGEKETLTTFGEGVKQGADAIYQGNKYFAGEQARFWNGAQQDAKKALEFLDAQGEGFDAKGWDVRKAMDEAAQKQWEKDYEEFLKVKEARRKERKESDMGLWERILHKVADPSMPEPLESRRINPTNMSYQRPLLTLNDALKEADGDVAKARAILEKKASEEQWADKTMREASEAMAKHKPVEGAAWWGQMVPQVAGQATAIGASFIPGVGGVLGKVLSYGTTAGLTASSAGQAMAEARQAGASDEEVWSAGVAQAVIEAGSEQIPLNRLIGKTGSAAFKKGYKAVADNIPEKELEKLLVEGNKRLGGKLLSGKTAKELIKDMGVEGASEFVAEFLGTYVPIIYADKESYPTLLEAVKNGWEGAKAGFAMGGFLGGGSTALSNTLNENRRKKQGFVKLANDKDGNVVEVVGEKDGLVTVLTQDGATKDYTPEELSNIGTFSYDEWKNAKVDVESRNIENAFDKGFNEPGTNTGDKLFAAEQEAKTALGLNTEESIEDFMGGRSVDEVAMGDEDLADKLNAYFKAKAEDEGRRERLEMEKRTRYAEVDRTIDNTANKDDGNIYRTKTSDGEIFITGGKVVLDNEGYIDVNQSERLVALMPNGRNESVRVDELREKIEVSNAQEAKDARHAEIDAEINAELSAPKNAFSVNAEDGAHTIEVVEDNGNGFFTIVDNGEQKIIDGAFLYDISGGRFGKPAEGVAFVANENAQPVSKNATETATEAPVANETETTSEVSPIPTETRGKVKRTAYHVVPIERTLEDFDSNELTEDEKKQFVQANIDEINTELQKVLKQEPKMGADIQAYKGAKAQWTVARDEWQKRLDYYNELLNRLNEPAPVVNEVASAVENVAPQATNEMQPVVEQAPIDNTAMEVAQETQNMQPVQETVAEDQSGENNEMVEPVGNSEQLANDVKTKDINNGADEVITQSDVAEMYNNIQPRDVMEMTPDEFIALHLPKITPESFKRETGLKNDEQRKLVGVIAGADKGGVTIEQAAEAILENYGDELQGLGFAGDVQEVRNTIIDILSSGNPRTYAKRGLEQRKQQSVDEQRAEIESVAVSLGFNSVEEWIAYEETFLPVKIEQFKDFDENEYYNNLAENYKNDTTRESENTRGGSELLQGEQSADNGGERAVGERYEGTAVSGNVQGGNENGAPQGNHEEVISAENKNNVAEGGNTPGQSGVTSLAEHANGIAESLGLNITLHNDESTITDKEVMSAITEGGIVKGWYNPRTGEIALYMPNMQNKRDVESTILHEAVSHYGIKHFLGKEDFDKFLDGVWEMMPAGVRARFLQYVGADMKNPSKAKMRQAADEYVAHIAETMDLNELERSVWQRIVDYVMNVLRGRGFTDLTRADIEKVIKASYADLRTNAEISQAEVFSEGETMASKKMSERRQEKNRINNVLDEVGGIIYGNKEYAKKRRLKREAERKELAKEIYSAVLKGDFNDVTLSQIDKFIEDATPANPFGRRISQRLPQRMERALRQGARANAVDALFSRISEITVPANERFSEAGRREIEERKKELLKGWAIATDNWHTDLKEFTDDTEPIGEGKDSKVYSSKDGRYVIKASKGKPFGKRFRPDIDNIALFNDVFRDTRYEILGYGEIDGEFVRILQQPIVDFAESTPLTSEERREYMQSLGFEPLNDANTAFADGEIVIADLQKGNVVRDAAGNISVIDADAKLHTKDVGGDYTYPPVETDLPEGTDLGGTMFRKVTPEMDAEYMAAVENGDMETAERLVKEAAKLAMPDTKVVDEDGEPMVVYHRTPNEFTIFDQAMIGASTDAGAFGSGFYLSPADFGSLYGKNLMPLFVNLKNPLMLNDANAFDTKEPFFGEDYSWGKEQAENFSTWVKENGYDGVWYENNGRDEIVATEPNQIKSADAVTYDDNGNVIPLSERFNEEKEDIRFRRANKNQDIFVSNAQRTVEGIKQEKATPEQWIAMLKKNGGLKAGEEAWLGLEEWLNEKKGAVTKQEILDFIGENKIQIEEVNYTQFGYGLMDEATRKLEAELKEIGWDAMVEKYPGFDELFEVYDGELLWSEERASVGEYEDFIIDNKIVDLDSQSNAINETREKYTTEGLERKREIALVVPTVEPYNASDEVHFGDAGNGRAVAWVRFGETTDSEGNRVLVIDEIQSKRHQDGREKGYRSNADKFLKDNGIEVVETDTHIEFYKNGEIDKSFAKALFNTDIEKAKNLYVAGYEKTAVPSAPFEKNWHELAMKRMLRLAAEEGFDKVAWTTGEQQAERYNMSKQVERIDVEDNGVEEFSDGTIVAKNVALRTANDNVVHLYVDADGVAHGREFDGKILAEIVGKELAEKIMQPGDFTIEGDGLRIGGEGMKGFYDKMLPSFVQKYTKKWGAKVGEVAMPNLGENNTMHSVDVTPEMQESVMEGQTMFRVTQEALDVVNEFNTRNRNTARVIFADGEQDLRELLSAWDFAPEDIEGVMKSFRDGTLAEYYPGYDKVIIYKHSVSQKELNGYLWHENAHRAVENLFSQEEMEEMFLDMAGDKIEDERARLLEAGYEEAEQAEEYIVRVIEEMYLKNPAFVEQNRFKAVEGASEGINRVIPKLKKIIDFIQNGNEEDSTRRGRDDSGLRGDKTEYRREVGRGDAVEMRNAGNKSGNAQETATAGGAELLTSEAVQQEADRMDADEVVVTASAVKALAQKLNTNVNIVEDSNSLPENLRAKKGWYDPKTGEVVVVMDNHVSMEDALQTVLHEIVGHRGLQVVLGDRMGEFLNFVYNNLPKNTRSRVNNYVISQNMKGNPMTQRQAVEEYIAELAERGFEGYNDLWNGIRQWFRDFFRNFMNIEVTDGELRYMLWKNYQRLQVPNVLTEVQERVMQNSTNTGDSGLMFRSTDGGIKAGYEKAVTGWWNKFKQGYYDQLRAVRKAQELIAKASGKKIADSEDVYSYAEHLPSINKIMAEQFDMFYMKPFTELLKKLHDKMLGGVKIDDKMLERYANAKHGLERNREMAVKKALTSFEEVKGKKKAVLNEQGYNDWKGRKADILANQELSWEEKQRELDKLAKTFGAKLVDYSGITAIFDPEDKMKYKELSELAIGYVNSMEEAIGKGNTDKFWKQIKDMTKYSLEQSYKSGLISKNTYDTISGLYSFYVPLRGFTEQTAEDIFDYVAVDHSPLSGVLRRAGGRKSEADNIFATIVNMAHSSIVMGNKNKMKQMALNLAMRHSTPLLSVDNAWYAKVGDEYIPQYPDIKEGMDEKAMADAFAEFEARMKEMEKNGEVVRHAPGLNIKERVVNSWNEQQHAIRVKRNGKEYVVWVNGSPTFANAINGMLKDNDKIVGMGWLDAINSFRSKAVTQYSPTFVFTNLFRDVQSASMVYGVLRGRKALAKFEKNLGVNSVAMMKLYSKYKSDTLDMNNEQEKFFKEFLENGGETGYTEMISIEEYQKMLNKLTEKLNVKNATGRAFEAVGDGIEFANRCVENLCRFSAYMTSRQMGMSIMQSVNDAKEVSVNFNRRGSGEMGAKVARKWFMFFNPAVQSVVQRILLAGKYPKRMLPILAAELAAGAALPYLFASLSALLGVGDDGEDDDTFEERLNRRLGNYYNLTDYRRRSSICFPTAGGVVNIPLSHEARVFFGAGELAASIMTGHEEYDNILSQAMNVLGQALPFNPVEGWNFGEDLGETLMYNLTPDAIKPFVEVGMNRDFAGNRIHNRTDYNRHLPEWMRGRKGTAEVYKTISRGLSGDESDFGKNVLDENIAALINPSNMEHLVTGYLGGVYTFLEKSAKSAQWALGDEEYAEFRNIPIASSFYTSMSKYEEKPAKERTRRDWEDAFKYYQKEVGLLDDKEKAVKNGIKQNFNNAQEVLDAMKNDGDLLVIDVFNDGYKVIKELYSEADVARSAKDMERLNEINNEIYAHKRALVERMEQMAENPLVGYDFLVGKKDTPYGRLETYGDLRDEQEINDMQKRLKVFDDEYKIADNKEVFYQGNKEALDLYDDLADIEKEISEIKKYMQDEPEDPEEDMRAIRELRTEAMNLISGYNE